MIFKISKIWICSTIFIQGLEPQKAHICDPNISQISLMLNYAKPW